ncbi:Acyl-CoA dehydrogenase OS=Streptomyces antimycoticus OX=68175 GN=SANT12839_056440 PE=3 SV=1 [Streptomyces antimycoticus]
MSLLAVERGVSTLVQQIGFAQELSRVVRLALETGAAEEPVLRDRLIRQWAELKAMRWNALRTLGAAQNPTANPARDSAVRDPAPNDARDPAPRKGAAHDLPRGVRTARPPAQAIPARRTPARPASPSCCGAAGISGSASWPCR